MASVSNPLNINLLTDVALPELYKTIHTTQKYSFLKTWSKHFPSDLCGEAGHSLTMNART